MMSNDLSHVKIIDFGLATKLDAEERQAPFNTFMNGTVQYMAPEIMKDQGGQTSVRSDQIAGELQADLSKVDTYALGVILINMLTGSYLFKSCQSEDYKQLMASDEHLRTALKEKLRQENTYEAELDDLVCLIKAMLHPDPEQRISIDDLTNYDDVTTNWLYSDNYGRLTEQQIKAEMQDRIDESNEFHQDQARRPAVSKQLLTENKL